MSLSAPSDRFRVFIVEDETIIRLVLSDMLQDLGYDIAAECGRVDEAMNVAEIADFDVAILDVNVNGETIAPVIDILRRRGKPLALITGYAAESLEPEMRGYLLLQKPFHIEQLDEALRTMAANMAA